MERRDISSQIVSCLFTAGITIALTPIAALPATSSARKPLFLISACLMIIGAIGWLWLWLSAPRASPELGSISGEAGSAVLPDPRRRSRAAKLPTTSEAQLGGRVILAEDVTPVFLVEHLGKRTELQAEYAAEPYRGKWLRVRGKVVDVSRLRLGLMSMSITVHDKRRNVDVYMLFGENAEGQLNVVHRGQAVQVIGRIDSVQHDGLKLTDCELIV